MKKRKLLLQILTLKGKILREEIAVLEQKKILKDLKNELKKK